MPGYKFGFTGFCIYIKFVSGIHKASDRCGPERKLKPSAMRKYFVLFIAGFTTCSVLHAQSESVRELVEQGVALHDQGKYAEAIKKYQAALVIEPGSTLANYEIAFSYFLAGSYDSAITYSGRVLELNGGSQHEAYLVLGSSLDLAGKPAKAIATYEEGIKKYPGSNLLHYNLALTCFNQKDYKKAEQEAILAIQARPRHGSSHLVLAATMKQTGQRVKSLMALYYFLLLEPNSRRSATNLESLMAQLKQGVEKKDDKNISINLFMDDAKKDDPFAPAEMMISLLAASSYTEKNKDKSDAVMFAEMNVPIFSALTGLKKDVRGFWSDVYLAMIEDLVSAGHTETYSYYISQSSGSEEVTKWLASHNDSVQNLEEWISKRFEK